LLDAPPRSVLNLNVPALDYADVAGVRWARLAAFGSVRAAIAGSTDGKMQFELRATGVAPPPDSDQGLVDSGYASLTTLVGVAEAWPSGSNDESLVSSSVVPGAAVEPVHAVPDASAPRSRSVRVASCDADHAGHEELDVGARASV
jgi:hypothetical protein